MINAVFCVYDKPDIVGGPSTWIQWLLPELQERGIISTCLVFLHTGEEGPITESLRSSGLRVITTPAQHYTEDRVRWILDTIARIPCDVFVPNEVMAGYHAGRWIRASGIPTVGILHTDGKGCEALVSQFVTGRQSDRVTAVVAVSQKLYDQIALSYSDIIVYRIPYGTYYPEDCTRATSEVLRIGYFGRLAEEQKRISEVAKSFCRATEAIAGTEAVIYGDGPQRQKMMEILMAAAYGSNVRWGGRLGRKEMDQALVNTDVFVLLSDYEGLPISLMEAMAFGCVPVCLQMESGIPELVDDGISGLIVEDRYESFVSAIQRLKSDPALLRKLSLGAREKISHGYSQGVGADLWANLLQTVTSNSDKRKILRIPKKIRLQSPNPTIESIAARRPVVPILARILRKFKGL